MNSTSALASGMMLLAAITWLRRIPPDHIDDSSAPAEMAMACLLLNVAAFDLWLLDGSCSTAIRNWAWHAAAAGALALAASAPGLVVRVINGPGRVGSTFSYLVLALLTASVTSPATAVTFYK